jgi:hypothetical protein
MQHRSSQQLALVLLSVVDFVDVTVALKRGHGQPYVPSAVPEDLSDSLGTAVRQVIDGLMTHHMPLVGVRGVLAVEDDSLVFRVAVRASWHFTAGDGGFYLTGPGKGLSRDDFEAGPLAEALMGPATRVTVPRHGGKRFFYYFDGDDPASVLQDLLRALDVRRVMAS